ncbi:MAG: hypothetical protein Kow00127_21870 [Bacteroidales bacterium]
MKTIYKTLGIFIGIFFFYPIMAQEIENPGFELCEDAGTVADEPVDWSSIKTSDGGDLINNAAPVVWEQSDIAHTGSYSVKLTNVLTLGTIVATGIITNGRVHAEFDPNASYVYTNPDDARWHTPFSSRPDSVIIWARYLPQGTDTAQVKVLLHKSDGSLPLKPENEANTIAFAQINITGTYEEWTRFAAPFNYSSAENPEYVLMVLSSGAGTQPVEGSVVFYDDIEFKGEASGTGILSLEPGAITVRNGKLVISGLDNQTNNRITVGIYSMEGKCIMEEKLSGNTLRLPEGLSGTFLLRLDSDQGYYSQKIFINK